MTILFLSRRFYPLIGGVETHVLEISKRLIQLGHKVVVITEEIREENVGQISSKNLETLGNIHIIRINVGRDDWFKKFRIWWEIWKIKTLFSRSDIIHAHDVFFWYLPLRFLFPSKKVYTTFHGYETRFPPSKRAFFVRKLSEKLSLGNICVGDYIEKWYGTKPDYVTYGGVKQIQNPELKVQNSSSKLKIILLGRLEQDIGVKVYLTALKKLKIKKIKFNFESYGEGSYSNKLLKYGKVNGFTKDVYEVMQSADIIFCSSYLLMLQALKLKKIVIAVYENPLKEDYLRMSPFANFVYICKDANEVKDVINSVNKNSWKSKTMIDNGYAWAIKQTWEQVTNLYKRLWKI